jgi:GTPase SAR1 family protein
MVVYSHRIFKHYRHYVWQVEWQLVESDVTYDAYIVVFSVTDFKSFDAARSCLRELRQTVNNSSTAFIVVANKQDLVRNRVVPERGQESAVNYSC